MKSGWKFPASKRSDTTPFAEIPKQVELLVGKQFLIRVVEGPKVFNQVALPLIEGNRADLNNVGVEIKQRLIQVAPKPNGR